MIDINIIRNNPEWVVEQLKKREAVHDIAGLLKLDAQKRKLQTKNDELKAERNRQPKGPLNIVAAKMLKDKINLNDARLAKIEKKLFELMAAIPNLPAEDVIAGGKEKNKVIKTFGKKPEFSFKAKDHVALCTNLKLIDYERGAKLSGSGSWVYTDMGARLELALWNYFVDFHVANGYRFTMVPHLLNYESGYTAGQFPKFADDVFITNFDADIKKSKFLLPTSETALINMHRDEIIQEETLPIKYAGFSPCYRKEAGGYGASERGMIRGYQFNKVEMFIFCHADESAYLHQELVQHAEKLVEGLGLHYQTVLLAAGDTGAAMAKTFDIEVYIPSMGGYKEVSSASNAHDYQTRRANIRTKIEMCDCSDGVCKKTKTTQYLHTLNASGLATSRIVPAIVEQFQNADGSVTVPEVLRKYLGGVETLA